MRSLTGVRVSLTALSGLMIVTVAAIAIDLWTRNAITVGQVSFTLGLVLRLNMLLGRLMMQLNGMLRQLGLIENSMRLVSAPLGLEDRPDAKPLQVTEARIDVQNVTFITARLRAFSTISTSLCAVVNASVSSGIPGRASLPS
jgi:ATP-binding cassette subfamily B multidrug efflux pump